MNPMKVSSLSSEQDMVMNGLMSCSRQATATRRNPSSFKRWAVSRIFCRSHVVRIDVIEGDISKPSGFEASEEGDGWWL